MYFACRGASLKPASQSKKALEEDKLLLLVEDNGIGYEEEQSKSADKLGILGMKENISYIGGSMVIEGKRGKGTKIKVVCPIISYKRFL